MQEGVLVVNIRLNYMPSAVNQYQFYYWHLKHQPQCIKSFSTKLKQCTTLSCTWGCVEWTDWQQSVQCTSTSLQHVRVRPHVSVKLLNNNMNVNGFYNNKRNVWRKWVTYFNRVVKYINYKFLSISPSLSHKMMTVQLIDADMHVSICTCKKCEWPPPIIQQPNYMVVKA